MIAYDRAFTPPAPVLSITLSGVVHGRPKITVPAIIDTGAEITAIPAELKAKLRLYPFGRLELEDARGAKSPVFSYEASLIVDGQAAQVIEVILAPFAFAVLGRDWLQDYYLLLEGPQNRFQLSKQPI